MPKDAAVQGVIFCMNTIISLRIHGKKAEQALNRVQSELFRLEKKFSKFVQGSEVSRINQFAGRRAVKISMETYEVLASAVRLAEISHGLFDITISPLADLWNYKNAFHVPVQERLQRTMKLVDFRDLILDPKKKTAMLRKEGQSVDFGGIAKGYAGDCCIKILQDYGICSAYVNIGGSVSTLGNKPEGSMWKVGIRHPRQGNSLLGIVRVTGKAVVTSGDYERYFIDSEGNRRHHILNPVTGFPADTGLISVSVICDHAVIGDALSTAIFAGGVDDGLKYLNYFPGTEVIMVDRFQRVYITQGIKESFQAAWEAEVEII